MKYRADIDGLRALAIVPVVLHHAGVPGVAGGFVGVDIFFVISGYLITGLLAEEFEQSRFSLVGFYERRIRRILPALFAVLVAVLLVGGFYVSPEGYDELSEGALATIFFGSNFWLWTIAVDYFSSAAEMNFLLHTWSLAIEEQFYLVFPILLWATLKRGRRVALFAVIGLFFASFLTGAVIARTDPATAFYMSPLRFWELLAGAALALRPVGIGNRLLREVSGVVGLAAVLAVVFLYDYGSVSPWLATVPAVLGTVLLIMAGQAQKSLVSRVFATPVPVAIGLISYSLYLWHWPVIVAIRHHTGRIDLTPVEAIAALAVSFVLAWASWKFIEQPFRRKGPGRMTRKTVFKATGATALVLIVIGTVISDTNGLPIRLPPDARMAFAATEDRKALHAFCPMGEISEDDGFCQSAPGAPSVLLWGDSHARSAWPGLERAVAGHGLTARLAWLNGCPPLVGIQRASVEECDEFNADVIEFIRAHERVRTIVLHARWALAVEGRRIAGESGPDVVYWDDMVSQQEATVETNYEVFARAMQRTVELLKEMGREVVILGNVPEAGFSVADRYAFTIWKGLDRPLGPEAAGVRERHRRVDAVLHAMRDSSGVAILDIADAICDDRCEIARDGRPLYFDDDHLSAFGATETVAPLFVDYLSNRQ